MIWFDQSAPSYEDSKKIRISQKFLIYGTIDMAPFRLAMLNLSKLLFEQTGFNANFDTFSHFLIIANLQDVLYHIGYMGNKTTRELILIVFPIIIENFNIFREIIFTFSANNRRILHVR